MKHAIFDETRRAPRLGFMQGRLSPKVDGKIQAFPKTCWRDEFPRAAALGFSFMEWTLDQEDLMTNPLLTEEGTQEIRALSSTHGIAITSVTCDNFMQSPFFKVDVNRRAQRLHELRAILESSRSVGVRYMVIPLVDNGSPASSFEMAVLKDGLKSLTGVLEKNDQKIAFETDLAPVQCATFLADLDPRFFCINYDIGNSASLGWNPVEEFSAFGKRIENVHVKDRVLGGTTVPLGTGNADFDMVFSQLCRTGYRGNFILQTARADDENHELVLARYRDMVVNWSHKHGLE